jgi:uncharacterized membrane protein YjjB (DUF3815 family)
VATSTAGKAFWCFCSVVSSIIIVCVFLVSAGWVAGAFCAQEISPNKPVIAAVNKSFIIGFLSAQISCKLKHIWLACFVSCSINKAEV